ncbi:hypothetical protein LSCM1_07404 [Leishmania martiniquensis]|uniref:Uncharacterized protein n=1 Tax=Leishmania martiniquensis TaxID=1580590 RepID=A0A836HZW5_9TRYP|nr:hypothetical protein LSCM1_07404 [Leishmania martiniquensis]
MPDFSQFIKYFNAHLYAPTGHNGAQGGVGGKGPGGAIGATETAISVSHTDTSAFTRSCDTTWRVLLPSDAAAKESGTRSSGPSSAAAAHTSPSHPSVTIGRMMVSTEDRWRIQAQMRREEARTGQARKEYNKKVTRAIKVTKGPSENAFPPGRGRPL